MSIRLPLSDIQFITDFAAYAKARGPVAYDFCNPGNCACCQFLRDTGRAVEPRVVPGNWRDGLNADERFPLPAGLNDALNNAENGHGTAGWRFDLLADRLEALLVDAPIVERVS